MAYSPFQQPAHSKFMVQWLMGISQITITVYNDFPLTLSCALSQQITTPGLPHSFQEVHA